MSKLDGNNRWSSKFTLTEYVEMYKTKDKQNPPKPLSEQEMEKARDFILLSHLLTMIDNAIDNLQYSTPYVRRLYMAVTMKLHEMINSDKRSLGLELTRGGVKVVPEEQGDDLAIYYRIHCRGYEERFPITREYARAEMQVRLTQYNQRIIAYLKKYQKE